MQPYRLLGHNLLAFQRKNYYRAIAFSAPHTRAPATVGLTCRRMSRQARANKTARHWATEYDWRKCEARLNTMPQFITQIDGLDIHLFHVRSKHENALPLGARSPYDSAQR